MYLKKEKGGTWKWTGLFFGGMLLFTLLSRAAYQQGTAVVTTAAPGSGVISHTVRITGKTVQNQELAVTTVGGLRIAGVCVSEGQRVSQGDVLFLLDLPYLEEALLKQRQELQKQALSVQDARNQNEQARKQRSIQLSQAEENYDSAVSQAERVLERAEEDLEKARRELENFYNGVGSEEAEEEALLLACQAAKADHDTAEAALAQLQQEIGEAVGNAIAQAEAELRQTAVVPEETISGVTEPVTAEKEAPLAVELTQEQKESTAAAVRADYADRLWAAQAAAEEARQAVSAAEAELEAFHQRQSSGTAPSGQALLDAEEEAREAYEDAAAALETTKITYGQAVSAARLPAGTSSADQIGQITYEQMKTELSKLQALMEAEGKIPAPTDGIVTKCNVQTGEKTTDTTAVLLADMTQGCKFSGLATQEQSKFIGVGDPVTLYADGSGKSYQDLPVTTFSATEEPGGGYRLTVQLPANTLPLGANAELHYTKKSQPYGCCIPLAALRLDAKNQTYVLVVQQTDSVMGAELQAKKVNVTVLEQNETMAALAEGVLNAKDKVIIGSDREIDSGSRVRVE